MPVAAALVIGVGVSAATSAYSAKKAGEASEKAADIQTKAGNQALNALEKNYQQAREDFAPYRQAGQAAMGQLSGLLTPQGTPGAYQPPGAFRGPDPNTRWTTNMPPGGAPQPQPMGQPSQMPPPMAPPPMMPPSQMAGQPGTAGPLPAKNTGADPIVTMRGPDGSTTQMPMSKAQQYLGKPGFSRVG